MKEIVKEVPNNLKMLYKIALLMENVEFKEFFDEHFNYYDDITSIIMIMKAYQGIQNELKKKGDNPSIDEIIRVLHQFLTEKEYRTKLSSKMIEFMTSGNTFFSEKDTQKLLV